MGLPGVFFLYVAYWHAGIEQLAYTIELSMSVVKRGCTLLKFI